jgi:hypothetical protein
MPSPLQPKRINNSEKGTKNNTVPIKNLVLEKLTNVSKEGKIELTKESSVISKETKATRTTKISKNTLKSDIPKSSPQKLMFLKPIKSYNAEVM